MFILMLYVNDFLQKHFTLHPKHKRKIGRKRLFRQFIAYVLAVCLGIGMVTPVIEVYRGFYQVLTQGTIRLEDMSIGTFNREKVPLNFGCTHPGAFLFFKYLGK